jgi:hypothetical protein
MVGIVVTPLPLRSGADEVGRAHAVTGGDIARLGMHLGR